MVEEYVQVRLGLSGHRLSYFLVMYVDGCGGLHDGFADPIFLEGNLSAVSFANVPDHLLTSFSSFI
jgi:hypothetical protein